MTPRISTVLEVNNIPLAQIKSNTLSDEKLRCLI